MSPMCTLLLVSSFSLFYSFTLFIFFLSLLSSLMSSTSSRLFTSPSNEQWEQKYEEMEIDTESDNEDKDNTYNQQHYIHPSLLNHSPIQQHNNNDWTEVTDTRKQR